MPRTTTDPKAATLSFRIAPALKADLAALAEKESKPVGELLRELVRERRKALPVVETAASRLIGKSRPLLSGSRLGRQS